MRTSSCFCKGCLPGQSGEPSAVLDDHRDRLCAYFGVVFWMLALNWTLLPILDPTDDAGPSNLDDPSAHINPQREPHSGQQVRAPAWAAPTVLLFQGGRAGDLTPGQAYRADRGRSW